MHMGGKKKLFSLVGIFCLLVVVMTTGALCQQSGEMPATVTLKYWRVFDERSDFDEAIDAFQVKYPYVKIDMQTFGYDEYEQELLDAWVRGEGPDVFSVPNDWMGKYQNYIQPMPEVVNVNTVTQQERLGQIETYVEQETLKTLSLQQLKSQFVDVVYEDVVYEDQEAENQEKIYGLPLSVDTLGLYYNKDILNQAEIANPPKTWQEFVEQSVATTAININGDIVRSGAALGAYENIPRARDLITLLMLQNGTNIEDNGNIDFTHQSEIQPGYFPGLRAVDFYTSFSQEDKETYSWNEQMPNALEQFIQGNLAFFIGYQYQLEEIRAQAPNLNFDFTTVPQVNPTAKANQAYYWVETVSKNTNYPEMSWFFVQNITGEEQAQKYLTSTNKPAALRNLLTTQAEEYDLSPWVDQALTARSWYHGGDPEVVEETFKEMISNVLGGIGTLEEILNQAADKIELTYE